MSDEYLEDESNWYARRVVTEVVLGFEVRCVSYRWWPKRRAWYRCVPCVVEWPSSTHVDEVCPTCERAGDETQIEYLGMRPNHAPEEWTSGR